MRLFDVTIVGAGIAGLSVAHHLQRRGLRVQLFERGYRVGGRCATRQVQGVLMDHGASFVHASDPSLLAACEVSNGVRTWPVQINGEPRAGSRLRHADDGRYAFVDGINSFAQGLVRAANVTCQAKATCLEVERGALVVHFEDGKVERARTLVLAVALEQATSLLAPLQAAHSVLQAAMAELTAVKSDACIALLALYDQAPVPPWDLYYPPSTQHIAAISHESSKRSTSHFTALVYHSTPEAADHFPKEMGAPAQAAMLHEAGGLLGQWSRGPVHTYLHRWGLARVPGGTEFPAPQVFDFEGGARLALCGDAFHSRGGVEGAWLSGQALANRLSTT